MNQFISQISQYFCIFIIRSQNINSIFLGSTKLTEIFVQINTKNRLSTFPSFAMIMMLESNNKSSDIASNWFVSC